MVRAPKRATPDDARERARLPVDERRAQLLALGLRLFSERSYDELSIDDIARAAGISRGLLYHYFASKRDFYVETVRSAAQQLLDRTDPQRGDEPAALLAGLEAYLCFVEDHASAFLALMRGGLGQDAEIVAILESARTTFVTRILDRLAITAPPPALRIALRGWIGLVEAASLDWLDRRDLPRDELRDLLARMLVATLGATDTPLPIA